MCAISLALALTTHWITLRGFPNSGDEYSYLIGAEIFATGRLSVPSPEPRQAFRLNQTINDGRFFSKYPPGWPAVLSLGARAGAPWLVNPIIGLLTLVLVYQLAARHFSQRIATWSVLTLCASPYFVFTSASYFSQTVSLLWATVFLFAFYEVSDRRRSAAASAVMGVAAGMLFLTRPFTAVAVVAPLVALLLMRARHEGRLGEAVRSIAILSAAFVPFFVVNALYNHALTGNPWFSPFELYDPADRVFLTDPLRGPWWSFKNNVVARLALLNLWQPLSVVLLGVFVVQSSLGTRRAALDADRALSNKARPLLIVFCSLVAAYFFYFIGAGNEYGPRYLYEGLSALVILGAVALSRLGRLGPAIVALIVVFNVGWLYSRSLAHGEHVRQRMQPFELVRAQGLSDAIVFIAPGGSGDMGARDLTRNGITFDGPVLFVLDRGSANADVLERYPTRAAYRYQYDASTGTGTLTRFR